MDETHWRSCSWEVRAFHKFWRTLVPRVGVFFFVQLKDADVFPQEKLTWPWKKYIFFYRRYWRYRPPKLTARPWKWMVGILHSFWETLFSGAMLVSETVHLQMVEFSIVMLVFHGDHFALHLCAVFLRFLGMKVYVAGKRQSWDIRIWHSNYISSPLSNPLSKPQLHYSTTYTPENKHMSPKKGIISIGNTPEPTIDFEGTFVRFPGRLSTCTWVKPLWTKIIQEALWNKTPLSLQLWVAADVDESCDSCKVGPRADHYTWSYFISIHGLI